MSEPEDAVAAPGAGDVPLPLTARQSLFWLDAQLFPAARYHNVVASVWIDGPLDEARLSRAWQETVASVDALRLRADPDAARMLPVGGAVPGLETLQMPADDFAAWRAARCATALRSRWALWDAVLVRTAPDRHVLYFCVDHIIFDGQSLPALLEHLGARYLGREPPSAPSFAEWVRQEAAYRASPRGAADVAYWQAKMASGSTPIRPYGIARTDASAALVRELREGGTVRGNALSSLATREPFRTMSDPLSRLLVLGTALGATLHRVTGNREIVLGVPAGNRPPRFARTCGLLMEQLFLRLEVEEGDTFVSLGARFRRETLEALRHASACMSDRGTEYVTLNLLPPMPTRVGDLPARVEVAPATALAGPGAGAGDLRDTLGVQVSDFGQGSLRMAFDFHAATFGPAVRERLPAHFLRVLDAMAADPGARVDAVDLLEGAERDVVLRAAEGPWPEEPAPDLVRRFREQVARRPGHVAVEAPDATLTYAELDATTNRLARRLRALGVVRESRVGVAVPRGAGELCALLATLKAGGAYVPVDPGHPVERVRVILEDAGPEVLIAPSSSPLLAAMPPGTLLLPLDDLSSATAGFDDVALDEPADPEQLAYILFTSGSTGRPKGVEVLRGGFANFLRSMAREPGLDADDRFLAITTTTFDISGLELFGPLWVGATAVIVDRQTSMDPRLLLQVLAQGRCTLLQATPATWRMLVDAGWNGTPGLRMLCGGEPLSRDLADRLLQRGAELWNVYGPTETTVWSTTDRVEPGRARITIGRPIDRTRVRVLDPSLRLVPPGVVGELHIGGDGVARGYRGRPDLTADRFLADPFGPPGSRIYRTGDLGRLLEDGRLECLGRTDHQVKVRGFRIELGEIEAALRAVPEVREVVVVAEQQPPGDPRLVAYWVGGADRRALYDHGRSVLAPYMVPSAFVHLDAFPLTTSGKVDRKALPRAEAEAPASALGGRRPRNDTEARIAAIWADVLGVPAVGIDDEFFALGGTSLLAIRARSRMEQEFGIEVPLRAFFESPTVASVSTKLQGVPDPNEPIVVWLTRESASHPPLFCLFGVQLYQDLADALRGVRAVVAMHVPVRYAPGTVGDLTMEGIASRYVEQIRAVQPGGPYHVAGFCFGGVVAFEVARQLEAAGETVALVGVLDGFLPSARTMRRIDRIRDLATRAFDPAAWREWTAFDATPAPPPVSRDGLVDLDVTARELDPLGVRYESYVQAIQAPIVVLRATRRRFRSGVRLKPDLGWSAFSRRVSVVEVTSDHLGLLRDPHARAVADALCAPPARGLDGRG